MARGSKEGRRSRPAKGGEVDPTQEELQRALAQKPSQPAPTPAEVPPRDKDEEASETAPAAEQPESKMVADFKAFIATAESASHAVPVESAALPKEIPPELQEVFREVPSKVVEKYAAITDTKKRESYIKNLRISQQTQAERENEQRSEQSKKAPKKHARKPKTRSAELSPETTEDVKKRLQAEDNKTDVEAPQYKGHIVGDGQLGEIPEGHHIGSAPQMDETSYTEPEPADAKLQEFRGAEAKEYNEKQEAEPMPAVFRSNRKRPENDEPKTEKEKMEFPLDSIKDIVGEQLRGKARIDLLDITETPEGLQLHAELDAGVMGGKIVLNGNIVNSGDTIAVEGLDIEARGYVKSMIENNLSGFAGAIKSYFERQHGKPVSSIHVGGSGLAVEFDAAPTEAETDVPVLDQVIEPGQSEGTPKEWREKLRVLIEGAKEKLGMSERGERLKNYLAERSKELNEKAKEYGPKAVEFVGSLSEKYNTLNWKTKLVLTGGLVVGVSFTSTTLPLVSALLGGVMYGQRVIGGIGFAMNRRKALDAKIAVNPSHWLAGKSERTKNAYAAALAAAYMGGTALAVHEGVEALNALGVNEWLGNMLGHPALAPEAPAPSTGYRIDTGLKVDDTVPVSPAGAEGVTPPAGAEGAAAESAQSAAQAAAGEAAGTAPEALATVGASSRGYEGMMKDLMKHLPDTKPDNIPDGSDLAKLYEAKANTDPTELGRAIHRLAMDHKFFADNASFRVDVGAQMTADAQGNILFNGQVQAPVGAHMIPEAPVAPVAPAADSGIVEKGIPVATASPDLPRETVTSFESKGGPDLTAEQDLAQKQIDTASEAAAGQPVTPPTSERLVWKDGSGDIVRDGSGQPVYAGDFGEPAPVTEPEVLTPVEAVTPQPEAPEASVPAESVTPQSTAPEAAAQVPEARADAVPEMQSSAPVVERGFISNAFGLQIPVGEPHIYADAGARELFVYGGSPTERANAILEYLTKNPNSVIFGADDTGTYRIPWYLLEGKVTAGPPVRTGGFLGFFSGWMKAPSPDEFEKIIK